MPRELRLLCSLLREFTLAELLLCAFFLGFLYKALCIKFKSYMIQKARREYPPFLTKQTIH